MGSRNAERRQAKAIRRKTLLAERRRLGMANGKGRLAEDVRRAARAPLQACRLQNAIFESGIGMVILTRKTGPHRLAMACFLVDRFCLGVKDTFFREAEETDIESALHGLEITAPLEAVDPSYARKLLRDAAAYARSLGLEPPADYAAIEQLFDNVAADACEAQFEFGCEGRPLYVPGPSESPTHIRRRLDQLRRRLGPDGFGFGAVEDASGAFEEDEEDVSEDEQFDVFEDEQEDEEADIEGAYDPNVAPDPGQWLALDEQERQDLVLDYHRRAGVFMPSEKMHATIHVVIENRIALGDELPVRRAVGRLMAEGLDRHEAVHAVGSVLSSELFEALRGPEAKVFPQDSYKAAIERLTAETWRREYGDDEDEDNGDEDNED